MITSLLFQEFFERKRLQAKEKKVVQPKSPEDRSIKTISKDLLHLQAVSRAYDGAIGKDTSATHWLRGSCSYATYVTYSTVLEIATVLGYIIIQFKPSSHSVSFYKLYYEL